MPSRPLCEHTPAQHTVCLQPLAAPPYLADSSWSLPDTVGHNPSWHEGYVGTADEIRNVERPGARPVRRSRSLLVEGRIIVHRPC
jgi:hypothetical protein